AAADLLAAKVGNIAGEIGLTASETIPAARHLLNQWINADE
ncbi:MAG: hypothetical protein QG672_2955, partial [Pseudomonadota bacterium]|nr:hypothetical protein [Pseudomonadota bacterium]